MANSVTSDKNYAHQLIERMAPGQVTAVVNLLEVMLDPFARALADAPYDDEPVSEEEARELAATEPPAIPHVAVLSDFGLIAEDFDHMARNPIEARQTDQ